MIDVKAIRSNLEGVVEMLSKRGVDRGDVESVKELDDRWRQLTQQREDVRNQVKSISKEVASARKAGDDPEAERLSQQSRAAGDRDRELADELAEAEAARRDLLLRLPNLPAAECPVGGGPEDNVVLRYWTPDGELPGGTAPGVEVESRFKDHQRVAHWDIGEALGLLDLERGAKLSGSMFPMYRGIGASLVRALSAWALDRHSDAFEEIRPPSFVRTDTMVSTGHLPKFADDAYHMERDDLWAIPTAEVPLTSLARDEILAESSLPVRLTASTPCFRREAGSAGRDTRGLLRVHEFDKVEILAYATEDQARDVHSDLLERAEAMLRELGLCYRVLDLCTGDLGNSSARTFDLEVYSPGCGLWLEVSSVSWFSDYQARRANIRYRPEGGGGPAFVHTLNGSALAWPRTWAAIMETHRQEDGSVTIPQCLRQYLRGQESILPR